MPCRKGNVERAKWRNKCRRLLCDHLRDRLGMIINPADVRTCPRVGDGYKWKIYQPEKQYLFSKPLSKHSIGAYMELCCGLESQDKVYEAEAELFSGPLQDKEPTSPESYTVSLAKIDDLTVENSRLSLELSQLQDQSEAATLALQQKEKDIECLQEDLTAAQQSVNELKQQNVKLTTMARYMEEQMMQSETSAKKAISIFLSSSPVHSIDHIE